MPSLEDVAAHMDDLRRIMRKDDEEEKDEETNINEELMMGGFKLEKKMAFLRDHQTKNKNMVYLERSTSGRGVGPLDIPVGDRRSGPEPDVARLREEDRGREPGPDAKRQDAEGEDDDPEAGVEVQEKGGCSEERCQDVDTSTHAQVQEPIL